VTTEPPLQAGVAYEARLVQIVGNNLHFYPKEGEPSTIKVSNDIFLWHRNTEYHASETRPEITINTFNTPILVTVESYQPSQPFRGEWWADRVVIKEGPR
jgi:hypothetical protein